MQTTEWYRDNLMSQFAPCTGLILGGGTLLREFARTVATISGSGRLAIAVPFVGDDIAWLAAEWQTLPHHHISLRVVTRPQSVKMLSDAFGRFKWRSMNIVSREHLHSKVYGFASTTGGGVCLIGSHNLTAAAVHRNNEFGALYRCLRRGPELAIVNTCISYIDTL